MWKREFIDKWNAQARGFVIANSGKNPRLGHDFQMRDEDDPERGEPDAVVAGSVRSVCFPHAIRRAISSLKGPAAQSLPAAGRRPSSATRP